MLSFFWVVCRVIKDSKLALNVANESAGADGYREIELRGKHPSLFLQSYMYFLAGQALANPLSFLSLDIWH